MKRLALLAAACVTLAPAHAEWRLALPGWQYEFPRDHGNHPDFKTEWWYFTGNVRSEAGREFGYQLTFFRHGVGESGEDIIPLSRFVTRDIKFAHFAVSDLSGQRFFFDHALARGAFGEAGFVHGERLAWLRDWSCELLPDGSFRLKAKTTDASIDLVLRSQKAPVIHGSHGVSQKAAGEGRASHYYSLTRLATEGTVSLKGESFPVSGLSWFDHEWATNQLGAEQSGWDWFSLQFDDGTELMLFQLRLVSGGRDPHSGGTFVDAEGRSHAIGVDDFTLEPVAWWESAGTKGRYPIEWELGIPKLRLTLRVKAAYPEQELKLDPMSYWEGAVRAEGERDAAKTKASGYLEMTGYAGKIVGLQAPEGQGSN